MSDPGTRTETISISEIKRRFERVVDDVVRRRNRVIVERDGVTVVAIVPVEDLARLILFDAEWAAEFAVLDEIGSAFADADPEEIEREVAAVVIQVRSEWDAQSS